MKTETDKEKWTDRLVGSESNIKTLNWKKASEQERRMAACLCVCVCWEQSMRCGINLIFHFSGFIPTVESRNRAPKKRIYIKETYTLVMEHEVIFILVSPWLKQVKKHSKLVMYSRHIRQRCLNHLTERRNDQLCCRKKSSSVSKSGKNEKNAEQRNEEWGGISWAGEGPWELPSGWLRWHTMALIWSQSGDILSADIRAGSRVIGCLGPAQHALPLILLPSKPVQSQQTNYMNEIKKDLF